jgi:hypothetical protein
MLPYSSFILKKDYSFTQYLPIHLTYEAVTLYGGSFQNLKLVFWMLLHHISTFIAK